MRFLLPLLPLLFCGLTVAVEPVPAPALRSIPAQALRGEMQAPTQGLVSIDGVVLRLAPGLQIRDINNRIVLSAALRGATRVKYQTDAQGQLLRVWLLTAAEAAQP